MDENPSLFQTTATPQRVFPRMDLYDIHDRPVHVEELSSRHHLILISLKNTSCQAGPQLLKMLNLYGLDPDMTTLTDPGSQHEYKVDCVSKKYYRLLLKKDAYFIIMCPGTNETVDAIQRKTPFLEYPFIAGTQAILLAKALKVYISDQDFMPALLEVKKKTLAVYPICNYFHDFLIERLSEKRRKLEIQGMICFRNTNEIVNLLKRKANKCQNGNMVPAVLLLSLGPTRSTQIHAESVVVADTAATIQTKTSQFLDKLPSEIIETVFFFLDHDIPSLVRASATCRVFYIAVCHILISCLRNAMTSIKPALPQENGQVIWEEAEVADQRSLDRGEGVSFYELQRLVTNTEQLLANVIQWTSQWGPRSKSKVIRKTLYK